MSKRKVNKFNLSIAIIVPILFGAVLVAMWAFGLGILALFDTTLNILFTWFAGFAGAIALWILYFTLRKIGKATCWGIEMLKDFIFAEEEND